MNIQEIKLKIENENNDLAELKRVRLASLLNKFEGITESAIEEIFFTGAIIGHHLGMSDTCKKYVYETVVHNNKEYQGCTGYFYEYSPFHFGLKEISRDIPL
jgi:hypothetical protein